MELCNQSDMITNNSSELSIKSSKTKKSELLNYKTLGISDKEQNLINNLMRKYSYDPKLYIKNFVPVLRPKENDSNIIPSKLILNYKKRNSSTISHPSSSEDENEDIGNAELKLNLSNSFVNSVISDSSSDTENDDIKEIKNTRKTFTKIRKSSLHRNLSKKNICNKRTGKISLDLYEQSDFNLYDCIDDSYEKIKNKAFHKNSCVIFSSLDNNWKGINEVKKQRSRINSCSILETLQNKLKLDK